MKESQQSAVVAKSGYTIPIDWALEWADKYKGSGFAHARNLAREVRRLSKLEAKWKK